MKWRHHYKSIQSTRLVIFSDRIFNELVKYLRYKEKRHFLSSNEGLRTKKACQKTRGNLSTPYEQLQGHNKID